MAGSVTELPKRAAQSLRGLSLTTAYEESHTLSGLTEAVYPLVHGIGESGNAANLQTLDRHE